MDSGDVPEDLLSKALLRYPWARVIRLPGGTGYEELKMASAAAAGEDRVRRRRLFLRSGWLEALLAPFSDPSVSINRRNLHRPGGPLRLCQRDRVEFSGDRSSSGLYTSDRSSQQRGVPAFGSGADSHSNPAPLLSDERPACGRPSPAAIPSGVNPRPARDTRRQTLHHFIWRFLLLGYDGVVVPG